MNPDNQHSRGIGRKICELKTSLIYKVSSTTARAIQKNLSKNEQTNKHTNRAGHGGKCL